MKVKLYGFEVSSEGSNITLDDLLLDLQKNSGHPDKSQNIERRIYFDSNTDPKYHLGLVVTVKDQKRFCRLENDNNGIRITVENLTSKNKLMEFNFFAINKKNGIGIYQHYHQSCSVNVFGGYLKSRHKEIRERAIEDEINQTKHNNGEISKLEERKIRRKHSRSLNFSRLVKEETLEKILKEYKEVKSLEYEYPALTAIQKEGIPLSKYVSKRKEKLTFVRNLSAKEVASDLCKTITGIKPKRGRVHVVDFCDQDQSLKLFDIPDNFGEEEYDDVAMKLHNLDILDFANHKTTKELVETCQSEDYKHIFEANIR